jgi:tyrosine-specific transport protein
MKRRRCDCGSFSSSSPTSSSASSTAAAFGLPSAAAAALVALLLGSSGWCASPAHAFDVSSNRNPRSVGTFPAAITQRQQQQQGWALSAFVAADAPRNLRRAAGSSSSSASSFEATQEELLATAEADLRQSSSSLPMELLVPHQATTNNPLASILSGEFGTVLGASMLVTSNTIGAGCLVLPELTSGPGLALSTAAFATSYVVNLLSGLTIAHVAIEQHQQRLLQQQQAGASLLPLESSSFQDLAKSTLGESAGTIVSSVSLLVNAAVLSFDVGQVGRIASEQAAAAATSSILPAAVPLELLGPAASVVFGASVATLLANCSPKKLSNVASVCVTLLLVSFAGLLAESAPVLLQDPIAPLVAPGTASDVWGSFGEAAPVIFMSMVYQNIVPTIVKMLDYDAKKSTAALSLGSFVPLCLYMLWCAGSSVGTGGAEADLQSNALLAVFTVTTLLGSAIGTGLSLTEEVQSLRSTAAISAFAPEVSAAAASSDHHESRPQWSTVAFSFGVPLITALALGEDRVIDALEWAGSFGSPLLYGVLPAAMALQRRRQQQQEQEGGPQPTMTSKAKARFSFPPYEEKSRPSPFVYSLPSLGALGLVSAGFIGQELLQAAAAVST